MNRKKSQYQSFRLRFDGRFVGAEEVVVGSRMVNGPQIPSSRVVPLVDKLVLVDIVVDFGIGFPNNHLDYWCFVDHNRYPLLCRRS